MLAAWTSFSVLHGETCKPVVHSWLLGRKGVYWEWIPLGGAADSGQH